MLTIQQMDTLDKAQVRRFVRLPFRLYANCKQWVPPLFVDAEAPLKRDKHPFYEHSDADFFLAARDGRDVGRIAVLENCRYNQHRGTRQAQFYFFDCEDDLEASNALFERAFEWARARGLNRIIGPRGFGAYDGYGLLTEGFQHRQMILMNYNYDYYPALVEAAGFQKEVDFVSCHMSRADSRIPDRIMRIADRVEKRGELRVQRFHNKRELLQWVDRIGAAYNKAFVNNWEYVPLTEREIKYIVDSLLLLGDPRLIKIITHKEDVVGFVFAFPDVSAALQRARGHLYPFGLFDLLLEMRRTKWVSLNAAGILPEFQGRGGNALLYAEMNRTLSDFHFEYGELNQIAETAVQMRRDLQNVGAWPCKNHRVYWRTL